MKIALLAPCALFLSVASTLPAQYIENYSASPNVTIPDGDFTGVASSILVNGSSILDITSLTVTLTVTGGFNGDYFAYLVHTAAGGGNAGFVTLLNRVGVTGGDPAGYADAGFSNITFTVGAPDIHLYQNVTNPGGAALTGSWSPDGRDASPLLVTDASPRNNSLLSFNGVAATGTWTLFIADVAGGDQGQFVSWGMTIMGVPEPGTWLAGTFAVASAAWLARRRRIG